MFKAGIEMIEFCGKKYDFGQDADGSEYVSIDDGNPNVPITFIFRLDAIEEIKWILLNLVKVKEVEGEAIETEQEIDEEHLDTEILKWRLRLADTELQKTNKELKRLKKKYKKLREDIKRVL